MNLAAVLLLAYALVSVDAQSARVLIFSATVGYRHGASSHPSTPQRVILTLLSS